MTQVRRRKTASPEQPEDSPSANPNPNAPGLRGRQDFTRTRQIVFRAGPITYEPRDSAQGAHRSRVTASPADPAQVQDFSNSWIPAPTPTPPPDDRTRYLVPPTAFRIPSATPESDYSQTPTLNVSPASTEARGSRRRVLGLATTLEDSNCVYRPCGDVHEARGATPSKKNSCDTVSGSITPAATAPDVREPPQRPVRQVTVPSTRDLVYRPRSNVRNIPGATSAQAVCIPTASGNTASAATAPGQCTPQRLFQALGTTLAAHRCVYDSRSQVARHVERVRARQHVPNSYRPCSFCGDRASAMRTSAAKTSHRIGVRSSQQRLQAPQSHARQERLDSTTQTATPAIEQAQVPPEAAPHPRTFRRLTQAFTTTPHITRRVSDHRGSTQSKPDQEQDTSIHTRAPTGYGDCAEPARAPATCDEDISNWRSIPVTRCNIPAAHTPPDLAKARLASEDTV